MFSFSFHRAADLIRLYCHIERRNAVRLYLALTAICLGKEPLFALLSHTVFATFSASFQTDARGLLSDRLICYVFSLVVLSFLFSFLHRKSGAIAALTLPATNAEKFWSRILFGIVGMIVVVNLAMLTSGIISWIFVFTMDTLFSSDPSYWNYLRHYVQDHFGLVYMIFYSSLSIVIIMKMLLAYHFVAFFCISFAILASLVFRRLNWLYGILLFIALYAFFFVLSLVFHDWWCQLGGHVQDYILISAMLGIAIANFIVAYRAFCRTQIAKT